ncbi:MAG: FAD-binding oxidoreductase [Myxococcales bacterium]|nr:FAD-binding oxidoreductase [Myxococcales bacterium]
MDLQSRSYWLGLDDYTPNAPLDGDLQADVALVGGGFTSLWTALLLLEERPELDVVILEANAIGYGASGRNGGFAMTLVNRTLSHLAAAVGDAEARKIYLAAHRAVEHLTATVKAEAIACDIQPNGLITLSNTPPQDRLIHDELATAQRLGIADHFEVLDGDAARQRIHSERIRCGFREEACTLVNPARLARGLKRVVEGRGARVFEATPVEAWEERPGEVVVQTPRGRVTADRALVAANAYGTAWKPTRDAFLPFYTYICLTRPLTEGEWKSVGWEGREGAEDRRMGLHYFRPTIDGRILWGGRDPAFRPDGPKARYDRDDRIFRRMRESFEWFFPQLGGVAFEHRWGGPIAVTGNFMPAVGWFDESRRRVAFAHGYNGHGVAISNLAAHALADLFVDRESEWTELRIVGRKAPDLGPRLLRDPLVRMTVKTQIRADDEEREIQEPWVLRILNRLTGADLKAR